jgi:hypothetical protein
MAGSYAYVANRGIGAVAHSVVETSRNSFLAAGQGFHQVWILETDTAGDTLWSRSYDILSDTEYARRIRPTADGGYVIAGGARSDPDDPLSLFLMRVEASVTDVVPSVTATQSGVHLQPNVPNPFSPATMIRFHLPEPGEVLLRIHDPRGRLVRTLLQSPRPAGTHGVKWDGTNQAGAPVAGGVYFYKLILNGETQTRRMVLVR